MFRLLAALLAVLALAVAGCGEDSSSETDANDARTDATEPQEDTTAGGCRAVEAPEPRDPEKQEKPAPLGPGDAYTLTFKTNCGDFSVKLDPKQSPKASASLVSLAEADYFDDTVFHRIVPGFVIQGGDPTGTGTGGPGYTTVDRPPPNARYTSGVVAMAKAGNEPSGAAGSQFYVVTGEDAGLPPDYAIVGNVSEGLDVVQKIGRLGDASEQPTEAVVIEDVEVAQS
jgi:peptidyl-prolyl cis-trans isomerase B (cyclophilin B)